MCTVVCFVFFFLMNPKYDISTLSTNTPVPCFAREMKLFVVDPRLHALGGAKEDRRKEKKRTSKVYVQSLYIHGFPSIIYSFNHIPITSQRRHKLPLVARIGSPSCRCERKHLDLPMIPSCALLFRRETPR